MSARTFVPGKIFGRLTAVSDAGMYTICDCSCGARKMYRNDRLNSGKTQSCGCIHRERCAAAKKPPPPPPAVKIPTDPTVQRLRAIHGAMMSRCYNPRNRDYRRYGGRGIDVSARWHDVGTFVSDLLPIYIDGKWLDRINNDRGYSPENCRFATPYQQSKNRSNTITFPNGVVFPSWVRRHGLDYQKAYAAYCRVKARIGGMPTQRAVEEEMGMSR